MPNPLPVSQEAREAALREDIVHRLRSRGWGRIDAESEAENIIERLRARHAHTDQTGGK